VSDGYSNLGWLRAWIGRQIDSGAAQQAEVSAVPGQAMYLYGSIGVDTALTAAGEVWVGEYETDVPAAATSSVRWRRAEGVERLGVIVIGTRRFAELGGLLPRRSTGAFDCPSCRATGDWHIFSQDRKESLRIRGPVCKDCGGLGWRASDA
jgi:hypothetical protein